MSRISASPDAGLVLFQSIGSVADAAASKSFTGQQGYPVSRKECPSCLTSYQESWRLSTPYSTTIFLASSRILYNKRNMIRGLSSALSQTITLLGPCIRSPASLNLTRPCTYAFPNTFLIPVSTMYHSSIIVSLALRPTIQYFHLSPLLKGPHPCLLPD